LLCVLYAGLFDAVFAIKKSAVKCKMHLFICLSTELLIVFETVDMEKTT